MSIDEIKKSLTKQVSEPITFEVTETQTTIKQYNGGDLPAYFKWDRGFSPWYFRVRIREGKVVTDLLKPNSEGYDLSYSTTTSAFDPSNTPITEDEWRNEMHNFIKQIR